MKKNLRIVSVAAAALLAVAPVAASAVSTVNAAAVTTATQLGGVKLPTSNAAVNVKPNVSLNTAVGNSVKASISVSFTATIDGTTATANLDPKSTEVSLYKGTVSDANKVTDLQDVTSADAGTEYKVGMNNVSLNFGSQNANKKVTLTFPDNGSHFGYNGKDGRSQEVQLNKDGVVTLSYVIFPVTAKNFANPEIVSWFNVTTGAPVTSASIQLYAGSNAGKMNVAQVISAVSPLENKGNGYVAMQYGNKLAFDTTANINNLKSALKAMNIDVDADGWFVAPKSFTFNLTATSPKNDATATLPVTVNVPNGVNPTPATVPSQSKTIMHNAYFYDKDAKRVGTDKVTRYNTVTVATSTTTINGKAYYEVVENGKATGKFINADNIDGTKRTLKHNAYVYKSSKKRANKVVLKKGTEVTTYGGSYTFKNGKQYYKIGNNTDKTYVKASNF